MPSSYMPSVAYVAQALYAIGADSEWENASDEERDAHMVMARTALSAIQSWQAQHKLELESTEPEKKIPDDSGL